jgi:hypothetical protein
MPPQLRHDARKDDLLGDNIDVGGVDGFISAGHEDFAWCLTGKDIT